MTGWLGERLVADARPAVPRRALPEPLGGGVGVGLGRLEPVLGRGPRRARSAAVGQSARMALRLNASVAGHIAFDAEAERLALVARSGRPSDAVAREDREDRHGLAELAQARDEAAAREGDVVGMRRDEDMGHGRPSIPSADRGARSGVAQRSQPPAPTSGTKTQAPSGRSVHSFPCGSRPSGSGDRAARPG